MRELRHFFWIVALVSAPWLLFIFGSILLGA